MLLKIKVMFKPREILQPDVKAEPFQLPLRTVCSSCFENHDALML